MPRFFDRMLRVARVWPWGSRLVWLASVLAVSVAASSAPGMAWGDSNSQARARLQAKEVELARLESEVLEMQRVLERFKRLKDRARAHERDICGEHYRAALKERAVISARESIAEFDQVRAAAIRRYNDHRKKMIDCIDNSVANDPSLAGIGVTSYDSLRVTYAKRKDAAKGVSQAYKIKRSKRDELAREVKVLRFGLPPIEEEGDTLVRVDCRNGESVWVGNKQTCKCTPPYKASAVLLPSGEMMPICARINIGELIRPGRSPPDNPNQPGCLLGQSCR